jgi:hypothetical protein
MILPSLSHITSTLGIAGAIGGALFWGRDLMSKIESIRSNHLSHIQQFTDETRVKTSELVAGQERIESHLEKQTTLLIEQGKTLVEIATILRERSSNA